MHLYLCVLLSSLVATSIAITTPRQNVVLEKSCWTSDSCRENFKDRFTGRVSAIQMRVPWNLLYPLFNHSLIRDSINDLMTITHHVEPLFMFNHYADVNQLEAVAKEMLKLNLTRGAFLLDSTDAKENLAIIGRELSFINKVFRHVATETTTFYNIPPTSFLSSQHLHKYLSFVREHVTGIRIQVDRLSTGRNLADMLTLISNHSLVPEVEVKDNRDMQIVTRLNMNHITVYRSFSGVVAEDPHLRTRRAPLPASDTFNLHDEGENQRQAQLEKLFPSIGASKKTPTVSWAERRLNAKRNLEKLFDKIAAKKHTKAIGNLDTRSPELIRTSTKDGSGIALTEDRIFQESDNPRFPKQDITVSLIDRRGDVNAKDYDYVEFGNDKKEAFRDLSEEDGFVREQPKSKYSSKLAASSATTTKPVKDMELWEMETHPKVESRHRHSSYLESPEDGRYVPEDDDDHQVEDDGQATRNYYVNNEYQMADPQYYPETNAGVSPYHVLNYTTDQYYYPDEQHPSSRRRQQRRRIRRDIFSQSENGIHSLFQDIRDYYPNMLERLSVWRPKRDNDDADLSPFSTNNRISNLWGGNNEDSVPSILGRKARSSGFIRHDPATNEIGYVKPLVVAPVTLKPTRDDEGPASTILTVFFKGWDAFQEKLRKLFS